MKKYQGIKQQEKSKRSEGYHYRIWFRLARGTKPIFRNVVAKSDSEAFYERQRLMGEYRKTLSIPGDHKNPTTASFGEIWQRVHQDLLANNLSKKQVYKCRKIFHRLFSEFRSNEYPDITHPNQLSLRFFKDYQNYYVNTLKRPDGWGSELIAVKAIMSRLHELEYCKEDIIKILKKALRKPEVKEKGYPIIPKTDIKKLMYFIKKDRPDCYRIFYFIYRTGRRIKETLLIKKADIKWCGLKPIEINIRPETTKMKRKAPLKGFDLDLENHIKEANRTKSEWLFPNKLGKKCSYTRVWEYLRKVSKEIIGVKITPHYFRHRFVTECADANVPMRAVQAITGISDIKVLLKHYSHQTPEGQEKAFKITKL